MKMSLQKGRVKIPVSDAILIASSQRFYIYIFFLLKRSPNTDVLILFNAWGNTCPFFQNFPKGYILCG